ncbi:MAG TPA: transposase [Desulfuromonadales bacterium]|nr:transposase [Desulfuromonadales bacterium]
MPRTARLDSPGLLQHVIFRGVDRCDIFHDDADRRKFLRNLSKLLIQIDVECFAWSLMTSHVHLLLRPRRSRLASFMRRLLTAYALYFNRRHQRSGHLFQGRYKSIVCEEDGYLLELVRYIHLNPLRAGLVSELAALAAYPWCGHSIILGNGVLEGQVVDEVLGLFGKNRGVAIRHYSRFIADGVKQGKRDDLSSSGRRRTNRAEDGYDERILGSKSFIEELRTRQDLKDELAAPIDLDDLIDRVFVRYGVNPAALRPKTRVAGIAEVRSVVCYLGVRHLERSGVEVGRRLGLSRSGVSVAAGRGEQLVKDDPTLLSLIDK